MGAGGYEQSIEYVPLGCTYTSSGREGMAKKGWSDVLCRSGYWK